MVWATYRNPHAHKRQFLVQWGRTFCLHSYTSEFLLVFVEIQLLKGHNIRLLIET